MLLKKANFYLCLVLILALIIRLRGFTSHFLLSSDTARDILTAKGAILLHQLPWVGSFSSAGPFVFGPNWYWQLMFPQILFPNFFMGPWVVMLAFSILFVIVMSFCGKLLGGNKLGLITALLTAVSPAAVGLSTYATQHAMVEIFSATTLLGFLAFFKTKKLIFAFLMAVSIGAAISYHYQAINLMLFYPVLLSLHFWKNRKVKDNLKLILVLVLGSFIFLVPLIFWDSSRGFANTLHLIGYFKVGQYQIYVPNSWRIYLFSFWPGFLGKLVGGNFNTGIFMGIFTGIIIALQLFRKKITPSFFGILAVFGGLFLMMRYFRGERYDGYMVYFHPLVLILVAFAINTFIKFNKWFCFVLMMILMSFSVFTLMPTLDWNNNAGNLVEINSILKSKYPGQKFSIYAKDLPASNVTFSQSLILEKENLGDDNGKLLGVCLYTCDTVGAIEIAKGNFQNESFVVADLTNVGKDKLTKENGWYPFSAIAVYDDVQNWWKK